MGKSSSLVLLFLLLNVYISVTTPTTSESIYSPFLQCLTHHTKLPSISNIVFSQTNSSFSSVLQAYIRNARLNKTSTPKPLLIITPLQESHVQGTILCAKSIEIQVKIRSGGHDFEGISYISNNQPFIIIDMFQFRNITVDIQNELPNAVVQVGATLGEFYYNIWNKSEVHGFPAGVCPTVGIGGHLSGGGYGNMLRQYGLSIDNIIDAKIVDVNGRILNKNTMGEELFWAIRGGGGGSFGVILSYTVKLVQVPQVVTVFDVAKTFDQNFTEFVYQWQLVAPHTDDRLFMRLKLQPKIVKGNDTNNRTMTANVMALFLGGEDEVVNLMRKEFPLLGLAKENCSEMSWIDSVLWWGSSNNAKPDVLLDRNVNSAKFLKRKSDYVENTISKDELEGIWKKMIELGKTELVFNPYGGKMNEIASTAAPFPHRKGNLFKIQYSLNWEEPGDAVESNFISQARMLYDYMTPFVSSSPRRAYLNYRDLDIGINHFGNNSYEEGVVYGTKYFHNNFERLVKIKTDVDPQNFFRNEQSIPTHPGLDSSVGTSSADKLLLSSMCKKLMVKVVIVWLLILELFI